jgi:hypothetical protein
VGEMSRKKKFGIALLVVALLLPLFMASNWGLGILEGIAVDHAPADWAASLDLGVADFYGVSLRPGKQKEVCEAFLQAFPSHPRRCYAKFSIATCVERDIELGKHHARAAYEEFIDEYDVEPKTEEQKELVDEANRAIVRLRNN